MTISNDAWTDRCLELGLTVDLSCWQIAQDRLDTGLIGTEPFPDICVYAGDGTGDGRMKHYTRDMSRTTGIGYWGTGDGEFNHGAFGGGDGAGCGLGYGHRKSGDGVIVRWGLRRP